MLARLRKSAENKDSGFTLIELLVVMIIIGILAAIAIPAFLNQKKKAAETSAKSDASNISKEIAAALVDGPINSLAFTGTAPNLTLNWKVGTVADSAAVKVSAGNVLSLSGQATAVTGGNTLYCVNVTPTGGSTWAAGPGGLVKLAAPKTGTTATGNC